MPSEIVEAVTEDFVRVMEKPENQTGVVARMVALELLPEGVNAEDPRVAAIVAACKAKHKATD